MSDPDAEWRSRAAPYMERFVEAFDSLRPKLSPRQFLDYLESGVYGPHEEDAFIEDMAGLYGAEEADKLRKIWRIWYEVVFAASTTPVKNRSQHESRPLEEITRERVAIFENKVREELLRSGERLIQMSMADPYGTFAFVGETYTPVKERISRPMAAFTKEIREKGDFDAYSAEMERLDKIAKAEGKVKVWHRSIEKGRAWTTLFHNVRDCYVILELGETRAGQTVSKRQRTDTDPSIPFLRLLQQLRAEPGKYEITNEFLLCEDLPPDYIKAFPKDPLEYAKAALGYPLKKDA